MAKEKLSKADVMSWGWYPFSLMGAYLRTNKKIIQPPKASPIDNRFQTSCMFAKATIPMDSARIIYNQVDSLTKEVICSVNCGLKCYTN